MRVGCIFKKMTYKGTGVMLSELSAALTEQKKVEQYIHIYCMYMYVCRLKTVI